MCKRESVIVANFQPFWGPRSHQKQSQNIKNFPGESNYSVGGMAQYLSHSNWKFCMTPSVSENYNCATTVLPYAQLNRLYHLSTLNVPHAKKRYQALSHARESLGMKLRLYQGA